MQSEAEHWEAVGTLHKVFRRPSALGSPFTDALPERELLWWSQFVLTDEQRAALVPAAEAIGELEAWVANVYWLPDESEPDASGYVLGPIFRTQASEGFINGAILTGEFDNGGDLLAWSTLGGWGVVTADEFAVVAGRAPFVSIIREELGFASVLEGFVDYMAGEIIRNGYYPDWVYELAAHVGRVARADA